jgi:ABC-2 type transport system permease protein
VTAARAGLPQAVAAEWTKLAGLRSTIGSALAVVALPPVLAVFVGVTGSLRPDDTVTGGSLTGGALVQLAAAVLGVLAVTAEYGTGTIRATLAACPRRTTVLAAKALVLAAVTVPLAAAGSAVAVLAGGALIDDSHPPGRAVPAVLGTALAVGAVALLGLALGTLLRHAAGAVAAALGVVLLPSLLAPLFGDLQRWVAGAGPVTVQQKLAQSSDATAEVAGSLGAWPSLGLLGAAVGVVLLAAGRSFARRDV